MLQLDLHQIAQKSRVTETICLPEVADGRVPHIKRLKLRQVLGGQDRKHPHVERAVFLIVATCPVHVHVFDGVLVIQLAQHPLQVGEP